MGLRIQYWLSTGLAGILLALVIANVWFYQGNVERQAEVNQPPGDHPASCAVGRALP